MIHKRKLGEDEMKLLLISKMMQYLAGQVDVLPVSGAFEPHFAVIDYPGTKYEGFLWYEYDTADTTGKSRRVKTAMCPKNSDRAVSHYIFKGNKTDCLNWLREQKNVEVLRCSFEQLKEKTNPEE